MERSEYIERIKFFRKTKTLHTEVEKKLIEILSKATPDFHAISEPIGLAGGRNDLILFTFNGRKVLFEIFATASQVSRDLRILDKTKADCKIAIIIDKDIDAAVFERFLRENPEDNYPFVFINELFKDSSIDCILKLRELICGDEEAKFHRLLKKKLEIPDITKRCREEGIDILFQDDLESKTVTFQKVFLTLILNKLQRLGVNRERLLGLLKWMSNTELIRFTVMKVSVGFNMFLYTDLDGNKAIYSDNELLDWLSIGYMLSEPYILLSLNTVVYDILDKYLKESCELEIDREIRFTIGHSSMYNEPDGRVLHFSIPRNTKLIRVFRPMKPMSDNAEELTAADYQRMMEFV